MKNSLKVSKMDILQKRTFTPKLTADDTIAFAFLAAERGLTPEQLIENFVRDIVSSFYSDEVTEEEKHLLNWFNGSWFSQDNDGYFSFLQYIIRNKYYKYVTATLSEIKLCDIEISKRRNVELYKKLEIKRKETIEQCFKEYCIKNPAHRSFDEEIGAVMDFGSNIDKLTRGRKNKLTMIKRRKKNE